MADHEGKKLNSERAAEEIRADELVKVTQQEALDSTRDPLRNIPVSNHNYWRFRGEDHHSLPPGIKWGVIGLVVLFIIGFAVSYYAVKHEAQNAIASRAAVIAAGVQDLQNLDPASAAEQFSTLNLKSPSGLFSVLSSFFGNSGPVQSFADLATRLTALSNALARAETDVFGVIMPNGGSASTGTPASVNGTSTFVGDLQDIQATLQAIDADANQLSSGVPGIGNSSFFNGASYLALKAQIEGGQRFLGAFLPWFADASTTHHMLVLFENPSEMRPGGGFLGSYADVSVQGGHITDVAIHDIADVDIVFKQKIIPPVPLQLEETSWRPADANWFFDFPTTASKTLQLFNASGLYANGSTTFDGVIAVTPQALSDLLTVTGPITLPGPTPRAASTTFTADNLTVQIQSIVQAGQGKTGGNPTYPKQVLANLYQAILGRMASSTADDRTAMIQSAFNWIGNRDAMLYFNDPTIESYLKTYGATGDQYELPQNFNGDYFALANADINSDKSERYITQTVTYAATIGEDGTLTTHVLVDRVHNGDKSPYWWYRTANTDYMQIYAPIGTALVNQSGGIQKTVPAPVNYKNAGYTTDPLLAAIASTTAPSFTYPKLTTREEGDKDVYALWTRVPAGGKTEAVLDYTRHLFVPPAEGVQYQFVFERSSGAAGEYKIEIDAPLGYVFAENGLASFLYDAPSTPGRMTFELTLQKLKQQ